MYEEGSSKCPAMFASIITLQYNDNCMIKNLCQPSTTINKFENSFENTVLQNAFCITLIKSDVVSFTIRVLQQHIIALRQRFATFYECDIGEICLKFHDTRRILTKAIRPAKLPPILLGYINLGIYTHKFLFYSYFPFDRTLISC